MIVARVDGDADDVRAALAAVPDGRSSVDAHGNEVVISSENGSAAVSDVAVALRDARRRRSRS